MLAVYTTVWYYIHAIIKKAFHDIIMKRIRFRAGAATMLITLLAAPNLLSAAPRVRLDHETGAVRQLTFANTRDGYAFFRRVCKTCHTRDNDRGAPFLHSESKTPRAWDRVFITRYPRCAGDGAWDSLAAGEISQLHDYLYQNGRDTFDPNELRFGRGLFGFF